MPNPSTALLTLALMAPASVMVAQQIAYDGFQNGPVPDLSGSTGGTGWTGAWLDTSTDPTAIAGPGLAYPGLASQPGAAVTPTGSGVYPMSVYQRSFAVPPGGDTLYVSFLMRDDSAFGIWGGLSFGQYPKKMYVGSPPGMYAFGLMMSEGLGDITNHPLVPGATTLVVVKITKPAGSSSGTYRLYLDPQVGSAEPAFPDAAYSIGMAALPTSLQIDNGTGFTTDEIRVGTSWSAVLPAQPPIWIDVGFAKPGTSGAPHLVGSGPLVAGSTNRVTLSNAKPLSTALLGVGANALNLPLLGGVLVPEPTLIFGQVTSSTGGASLSSTWPAGIPVGQPLYFQYWIQDSAASFGYSASNGLKALAQ
ncbi:MAG: hypothetical protein FJ299_01275 [Planctomycetes bacterium]|nr:hypothetical protein [Planctomycetota bacterium]